MTLDRLLLNTIFFMATLWPSVLNAQIQTPFRNIVFDDFDYVRDAIKIDRNFDSEFTEGSPFGTNYWRTSLSNDDTYRSRMWFLNKYPNEETMPAEGQYPNEGNSGILMTVNKSGYKGSFVTHIPHDTVLPRSKMSMNVVSGFQASQGTWAASIAFTKPFEENEGPNDGQPWLLESLSLESPFVYQYTDRNTSGWYFDDIVTDPLNGLWFNVASRLQDRYFSHPVDPFDSRTTYQPQSFHMSYNSLDFSESEESCYGKLRLSNTATRIPEKTCFDYFMGNIDGQKYTTIMVRLNGEDVTFEMVSQHNMRVDQSSNYDYSFMQMTSQKLASLINPLSLQTRFYMMAEKDLNGPFLGERNMAINWFFYTPDTDLDIYSLGNYVSSLRGDLRINSCLEDPLREKYSYLPDNREYPCITRINTMMVDLEGPYSYQASGTGNTGLTQSTCRHTYEYLMQTSLTRANLTWQVRRATPGYIGNEGPQYAEYVNSNDRYVYPKIIGSWINHRSGKMLWEEGLGDHNAYFDYRIKDYNTGQQIFRSHDQGTAIRIPRSYYNTPIEISVRVDFSDGGANFCTPVKKTYYLGPKSVQLSDITNLYSISENTDAHVTSHSPIALNISSPFPNPANEWARLSVESQSVLNGHMFIYDIAGRALITKDVNISSGKTYIDIETSSLPSGTYRIKMILGDNVSHHSIVVSH